MKKWYFFLAVLAFTWNCESTVFAQRTCGTMERWQQKVEQNPKLAKMRQWNDQRAATALQHNTHTPTRALYTIPVVVHVLWNTNAENISDTQVLSQIEVLNADFALLNADTVNIPQAFKTIVSATEFQFCMAQQDPEGNPTNGIHRVQTATTTFGANDQIKSAASGGADAWDPTRYFNIWVGDLGFGLLGYAQFPDDPNDNTYGVAINYTAFGNTGTAQAPFGLGRTASHEIGHCFGLYHIWGDDNGACSGSDQVADTPNQGDATSGCGTFPELDNCTTTGNGIMFMNYMDYSDDDCLNMFTRQQSQRMTNMFEQYWSVLAQSTACSPPIVYAQDAGVDKIWSPEGNACETTIYPTIRLKNFGSEPLTSVLVKYTIDNGAPLSFAWTGNLAAGATADVVLPETTVIVGTHTIRAYTELPNNIADPNNTNDDWEMDFQIIDATPVSVPLLQGVETLAFPSDGWEVVNPDGGITWERTTAAKKTGNASVYINNYDYDTAGNADSGVYDDFISPPVDLTALQGATLDFQVAYASYTAPATPNNTWDTLQIWLQPTCGGEPVLLYNKYSSDLATANNTTNIFTPTASQWRMETIDLQPYTNLGNVRVVFRNRSHFENNLYIDDINIHAWAVGNNAVATPKPYLHIAPNPFDQSTQIHCYAPTTSDIRITIYDAVGKQVLEQVQQQHNGSYHYTITEQQLPSAGIYVAQIHIGNAVFSQKIVKH